MAGEIPSFISGSNNAEKILNFQSPDSMAGYSSRSSGETRSVASLVDSVETLNLR